MAIVVLAGWLVTAVIGLTMLRAGGAARRAAGSQLVPLQADAPRAAAMRPASRVPDSSARLAAVPFGADGSLPPVPNTRVATPPGEHPLLEFSHPALAVSGLAAWTMFVLVHYRPLAWIAFGILLATMGAGLGWLTRNKVDRTRKAAAAWDFPLRLVVMHGLAAVLSITLTVLTALLAAHG